MAGSNWALSAAAGALLPSYPLVRAGARFVAGASRDPHQLW
jgi:hypothetical protein